jgi:hypothetical protein
VARADQRSRGLLYGCALLWLSAGALGCSEGRDELRFEIAFADGARADRAALIQARIGRGECGSDRPIYVSDFTPSGHGERPPALGRGRYVFSARAQDADCFWYASGCRELNLPDDGAALAITLAPIARETRDCDTPACHARACLAHAAPDAGLPESGTGGSRSNLRDAGGTGDAAQTDEDAAGPRADAAQAVPPEPVLIEIEAERAEMLTAPLVRSEDPMASNGAYVSYPYDPMLPLEERQALKRAVPPMSDDEGGIAAYRFELPRTDSYRLWGRVITSTLDEDSFWLRIDDGDWMQWNDIAHGDQWHWVDMRPFEQRIDRFVLQLAAGPHTLRVSYRELGARLDQLLIVSDLAYVPWDP